MKITLFILMLASFNASAELWNITWVNPTEREDNTPYDHATEGKETTLLNSVEGTILAVLPTTATNYEAEYQPGCYSVVATVKDTDGRESLFSKKVEWCILANPKPMTSMKVTRRLTQ